MWPKVKMKNLEEVKAPSEYPLPEVLEKRNNRRDKYIHQLIKARAGKSCDV